MVTTDRSLPPPDSGEGPWLFCFCGGGDSPSLSSTLLVCISHCSYVCAVCCVCVARISWTLTPSLPKSFWANVWGGSLHRTGPLALGGEGATKLRFLTILSAAAGATHWVFPLQLLKSPYCPLWSVFCTPCLQNFVSAKILLMVQVFCLKISWESELGARASGLSFHLLGCHLLSLFSFLSFFLFF